MERLWSPGEDIKPDMARRRVSVERRWDGVAGGEVCAAYYARIELMGEKREGNVEETATHSMTKELTKEVRF